MALSAALVLGVIVVVAVVWVLSDFGSSPRDPFQRAVELQQAQRLESAVVELKNVLIEDPLHAEARGLLGQIYVALGNGPAAVKELERAQELGYQGSDVSVVLTRALLLQGQYRKALERLDEIRLEGDPITRLLLRGQAHLGMHQLDKAMAAFEQVLHRNPGSAKARLGLARAAFARKDWDTAKNQLGILLEAAPDYIQAWLLKAQLELSQSNREVAERAFEAALKISENKLDARFGAAWALLARGQSDAAVEHAAVHAQASLNNPLTRYLRALATWQKRNLADAQAELWEVLNVLPNHPPSLLLLGWINYQQQNYWTAEELLTRYLEAVPGHLDIRKLLAAVYLQLNQPQQAIDTLAPEGKSVPVDVQLLAMLGSAYLSKRQFGKGAEYLERAAELVPKSQTISNQFTISHLATVVLDQPVTELQTVVKVNPDFMLADLMRVLIQLRDRNFDDALSTAEKLAEKRPKSPLPYNFMGVSWEGKQEPAQARKHYERALAIEPTYSIAALKLARLDSQEGQIESARKRYESILDRGENNLEALVGLAKLLVDSGHSQEGLELLEQARAIHPQAFNPPLILGSNYPRQESSREAPAVAREPNSLVPDDPTVLLSLGQAQLAAGEHDDALATLRTLTKRYPQYHEAYFQLAVAQSQAGDTEGSRSSLQKTLELEVNYLPAMLALGNLELRAGKLQSARAIAKALQQAHPDAGASYLLRGDVLMAEHKVKDAVSAYGAAFSRAPNDRLAIKLGQARSEVGDTSGAYDTLKTWLASHPKDRGVRLVLAATYDRAGRKDLAIDEYNRALEQWPTDVLALNNLAWLYYEQADSRALGTANQAYQLAPERPEVLETYGWLLIQHGHMARGLALLENANQQTRNDRDIHDRRGADRVNARDRTRTPKETDVLLESGLIAFRSSGFLAQHQP